MRELLPPPAAAQAPEEYYRVETVATPEGIAPEVSAIAFRNDGSLIACFRRGQVYILDPAASEWKEFASGLHTPLGVMPGRPGELFIAQVPELTRVVDTDADGRADLYETISDDWGLTGNYHEFVAGPLRDAQGNFYISVGCTSDNAEVTLPVRGEFTERGHRAAEQREGIINKVDHYSPVPYRGWILKITPEGKMLPFASGFRQPNGICFNSESDLFSVDNQGEWVGTSPLHHVTQGRFYGHPASLNWRPDFKGKDPVEVPVETVAELRTPPAIQFPQNDMAGSVAQPLFDTTAGKFGPYSGQLFVAEWTYPRILRVDLEKVGGEYQGACFIFLEGNGLHTGNNRLAFAPDGSLYVAQTSRMWGASEGLQRIVWTGKPPLDILRMRLTETGFELTFTKPVNAATAKDPSAYSMTHYYYRYHSDYGSPKTDVTPVKISNVDISPDGRRVVLTVDQLVAGRVYELRPGRIESAQGDRLITRIAAYTLNRLKD
ncbi:MAG: DUF7133 domain-containing protein [Acidobacteriota bacterium]